MIIGGRRLADSIEILGMVEEEERKKKASGAPHPYWSNIYIQDK